jgi:hypothetical protein
MDYDLRYILLTWVCYDNYTIKYRTVEDNSYVYLYLRHEEESQKWLPYKIIKVIKPRRVKI